MSICKHEFIMKDYYKQILLNGTLRILYTIKASLLVNKKIILKFNKKKGVYY